MSDLRTTIDQHTDWHHGDDERTAIDAITAATTPDDLEAAVDRAERLGVLDLPIRIEGWLPDTYVGVRRWELGAD